jgi:CubicO group peptidase (beta-lactamase class C family)
MKILLSALLLTLFFCDTSFPQKTNNSNEVNSFANNLNSYLQQQSDAGFSGAVLVVKQNKIVLDKTYGGASKIERTPPAFWIASNSKSFVAAAALKLQEQGKLSVNDPITKFFKNVPGEKHPITVHHLLAHTSGLPHRYASDGIEDREEAVQAVLALPLSWKVGEGFHYSNDGYSLLAAIVEIASKQTFEEYLRKNVLKPVKLSNTGFWGYGDKTTIVPAANVANTQNVRSSIYKNGKSVANWGYRGATGMYSTAPDIYRWMLALKKNKILNPGSREQLWGKQVLMDKISPNEEQFYGYGWTVRFKDGKRVYVRHTGNEDWLGHNSFMCLFENGDAYVVLSNAGTKGSTAWGSIISREIQKRLLDANINAEAKQTPISNRNLNEQIHTYLSRLEGFGFSGGVLVAQDGKILVESYHGLADRRKNFSASSDTIFGTGSVTKPINALAILALESDGKLNVTDPISKYLKNVPEDKTGITIHHLLTHTSGLAMGFGGDYEKVSREELIRRAMSSKLLSQPGERHAYSNAGYSLLAAIVEIVSGKSIDTFSRERLFRPAGMTSTGYFFPEEMTPRLARGYRDGVDSERTEKKAALDGDLWNLLGNGGIYSTLGDMYKLMKELEQGKLLKKDSLQKYFRPHAVAIPNYRNSGTPLYYSYGWYVWKQPSGKTLIWHLGGDGIENFAVRWHRDDRRLVIYASNVSEFHDPVYPVPAIERILAGETIEMPPQVIPLNREQLMEFAGKYRADSGAILSVEAKDSFLRLEGEGQEAFSFITDRKWQNEAKLEALNARTAEAVENSRTGKYDVLLKMFGQNMTEERLGEFETLFWKKRHDLHGDYVKTRVLGTIPSRRRGYVGTTIVAIDFQRGVTYREYLWTPEGTIGDLGPIEAPPSIRYFPVSDKCFAAFEPAQAVTTTVCFDKREGTGIAETIMQLDNDIELKKAN